MPDIDPQNGTASGAPIAAANPILDRALTEVSRDYEERTVVSAAASLKLPTVDLRRVSIDVDLFYLVSKDEAAEAQTMPFFRVGKKVKLAVVDPALPAAAALQDRLRQRGYQLHLSLTSRSGFLEALPQYDTALVKRQAVIENVIDENRLDDFAKEIETIQAGAEQIASSAPNIALNFVLVGAMRTHASDIHMEPYEQQSVVRMRIDGVLQPVLTLDRATGDRLVQAVKHQAHLKFNIIDRPQDGRFSFTLNTRLVDVRVSSLPTIYGEGVVLRLLDAGRSVQTLDALGLRGRAAELVREGIVNPHGMILSTGPTGSGKTTTQYAILNELSTPEVKVVTLEDPVEYRVRGITQSQIEDEQQFSFADALRAVLRHDPDVIMVGEIRDLETAEIAAQAALTGHTVLSTLHTNDAASTVTRLINMGLPAYVVAPALDVVIAQRLVRRVCDTCRSTAPLPASERAAAEAILTRLREVEPGAPDLPELFAVGEGCEACSGTGYRGQIGLYEVFRARREMETAILANDVHTVEKIARADGMRSLREDGLSKVLTGETTMHEVLRVTLG